MSVPTERGYQGDVSLAVPKPLLSAAHSHTHCTRGVILNWLASNFEKLIAVQLPGEERDCCCCCCAGTPRPPLRLAGLCVDWVCESVDVTRAVRPRHAPFPMASLWLSGVRLCLPSVETGTGETACGRLRRL
ncbi:hypothetical protein XELAEV_18010110mg [Xenopus laevis]|uniref:Uncharacterized protein n=1 Tax=Xenopus laevis TaxID=8355 RepID=A0A974I107_XENLA|nr:hypothetical protein XELAEV_18010110mg [Xenopus laevis]